MNKTFPSRDAATHYANQQGWVIGVESGRTVANNGRYSLRQGNDGWFWSDRTSTEQQSNQGIDDGSRNLGRKFSSRELKSNVGFKKWGK